MTDNLAIQGPHAGQPILVSGSPLAEATSAMIMVHGRGASAEDILGLSSYLPVPGMAYIAPQAANATWYPNRFIAPLASNEPWLSSALSVVGGLVAYVEAAGIPAEKIVLLGFSQGACLALEFAARNARRYGGVVGLSGGLIGPEGTPRDYAGSLAGTPAFLGCSDIDAHVPVDRVHEAAEVFGRLGAQVDKRIYPGMGHTINDDEFNAVRAILEGLA
jgi:predicted esterase